MPPMPTTLEEMLPVLVTRTFSDPGWIYEPKWVSWRTLCLVRGSQKRSKNKAITKLAFKFIFVGAVFATLVFYLYGFSSSKTTALRITVAKQPTSPLLMLSTFVDDSNPLKPRYVYSLTNLSDKKINAYAIQENISFVAGSAGSMTVTDLTHLPAVSLLFGPHESKQEESGEGKSYDQPPLEITLAVDFVAFADGSRWGDDLGKSDMLDGKRAGGKMALREYRMILARVGPTELEQALANADLVKPDETARSAAWEDGFKQGVAIVKYRLTKAKAKGGPDSASLELQKAFDSTDGRLEP